MKCNSCVWWRRIFCVTACAEMEAEFNRMDDEIIARWGNERIHKETE